ncbi:hypothetical protein VTK73DRAFT_937 [Phialemonium thermophilum]|uniref:Uncharacterized protein n=1 Tax=Phialemonium thermophilum TaxID=223376 RepID=A0ABR3VU36_9PEZI
MVQTTAISVWRSSSASIVKGPTTARLATNAALLLPCPLQQMTVMRHDAAYKRSTPARSYRIYTCVALLYDAGKRGGAWMDGMLCLLAIVLRPSSRENGAAHETLYACLPGQSNPASQIRACSCSRKGKKVKKKQVERVEKALYVPLPAPVRCPFYGQPQRPPRTRRLNGHVLSRRVV